jgi:glycosyltransferase involved in cell wall biosynthesis
MTPVTLVMAYYCNTIMLQMQYESIRTLAPAVRDHLRVVVVDDGSPTPAVPPGDDLGGVGFQMYRILVDNRWGQDAARNIGVRHAETNWVLLTDMDHLVPNATWQEVMRKERDHRHVFTFPRVDAPTNTPYKHHPNTWFMSRRLYDEVGGYDERMVGYYGSDGDFAARLRALPGVAIKRFKSPVVRVGRSVISDASTTTYLRKQPEDRDGLDRVRRERSKIKNWRPLRYQFPYERVHPAGPQR